MQSRALFTRQLVFRSASRFSPGRPVSAFGFASLSSSKLRTQTFGSMGIFGWLAVDMGIQCAGWAISSVLKTEKLFDALGVGSFAVLTVGSFLTGGAISPRKALVSAMTTAWSLRLGSLLVARVIKVGHDSRFDEVKHKPLDFLVYWSLQGVWVWVTMLPVLMVNLNPVATPLRLFDAAGIAMWSCGFVIEAVSDWQKFKYKMDPANKGKFISHGLWAYSRHPNYFGEILLWSGMFLTCVPALKGFQYAAIASPLLVTLLLTKVSGIPILEKQADERWGGQEEYERYKRETPILIPKLFPSSSDKSA